MHAGHCGTPEVGKQSGLMVQIWLPVKDRVLVPEILCVMSKMHGHDHVLGMMRNQGKVESTGMAVLDFAV